MAKDMVLCERGGETEVLGEKELRKGLCGALKRLGTHKRVLVIPPDFSRLHSRAGLLTNLIGKHYGPRLAAVLPALGTHAPMRPAQIDAMFQGMRRELFVTHDWRNDVVTLGTVPAALIRRLTNGKASFDWPVQVNKLLVEGKFDLILSVGQVVPHEVVGMANHAKNIFVGTGGAQAINLSHYVGVVCGMEQTMGRIATPVRHMFDFAMEAFGYKLPPVVYVQTVVAPHEGETVVRGLYIGPGRTAFEKAAALSQKVNITTVPHPLKKCVAYLDPAEFKSTWVGNKAIYRTRMAMADGGELIVIAPGVKTFGEDALMDKLIRRHGYLGTEKTLAAMRSDLALNENLGAAAHLIHGSSEGRFSITYAAGGLSRDEIEKAGFRYADPADLLRRYPP
ncbi:MAG: lactate racemase domain-containing protein, partial [Kiritimatiellaeota bacterium]|nr:lactate racemase domain-containing protein [Kiritimatiellota bacterium]